MKKSQEYIVLNSGYKIPVVGLGTFEADPGEISNAIDSALEVGYRHIDCASIYGNESEIGSALNRNIDSGKIKRSDIFITSKLWCDSFRTADVSGACEESLRKLGIEYLDLYLIHWPTAFQVKTGRVFSINDPSAITYEDVPLEETWKAMEGLVESGLVRSIGVSNFSEKQIDRILKICKLKPAVNQVEVSVNWLNTQMVEFAHSHGIHITAYAPFGSPAVMPDQPSPLNEDYVKEIAKVHGKLSSHVLIRHALQRGLIVIPKSTQPERIKSNFDIWDFELTEEEMNILNKSGRNQRLFTHPALKGHSEYPFRDSA